MYLFILCAKLDEKLIIQYWSIDNSRRFNWR